MRVNKKYLEYKENGLCRRCGNVPLDGKTRCAKCHEEHLNYQRIAKKKAISKGLCRYCLIHKTVSHKSMCEECLAKHSEKGKQRNRKYRQLCIDNYGGKCKCCGTTVAKYLQLDHVNNDGAHHRRELSTINDGRGGNFYRWAIANDFPERLQLLCANCHQAKSWFGGCADEDHRQMKCKELNTAEQ